MSENATHSNLGKRDQIPLDALLAQSRVAPEYTMGALVDRAGILPETLRSWERRYDFPQPARTSSNRRLYSERDIAAIAWLQEQTSQGQGIREAIDMLKSRLETAPETAPSPQPSPPPSNEAPIDTLVDALLENRFAGAQRAWDSLAIATSPNALGQHVILPVLTELNQADERERARTFLFRKAVTLLDHANPETGDPTIGVLITGGVDIEIAATVLATALAQQGAEVVTPFASANSLDGISRLRRWEPDRAVLVHGHDNESIAPTTFSSLLGLETFHTWAPFVDRDHTNVDTLDALVTKLVGR